ncbi:hypothetical protein [Paenirhodobacter populi]|uniref:hypothetical protein n=1 Tax=Paenirhodobacter populi TaxID=2306993 RepID=UPI000FE36099|nr:hypothetical protein [Sinirhodobacter populi]
MLDNLNPSDELLKAVRAGFIMQGGSLHAWAASYGVHHQNLRKALVGECSGPKAAALVKAAAQAAQLACNLRVDGDPKP